MEPADDLFQQTWIKAIDHLSDYQDDRKFISWLFRIGRNNAFDLFRNQQRVKESEIGEVEFADNRPLPAHRLDREELAAALELAVGQLPQEQREVVLLRRQAMPFQQIAELQDCSLNTALARMRYAVQNLRKHLVEWID